MHKSSGTVPATPLADTELGTIPKVTDAETEHAGTTGPIPALLSSVSEVPSGLINGKMVGFCANDSPATAISSVAAAVSERHVVASGKTTLGADVAIGCGT